MNIMMIIINTISICYVMLRNKPLFSYFYLKKNNITMKEFINFVNGVKDVDDVLLLTQMYEYNKQHKINPEWLNNKCNKTNS